MSRHIKRVVFWGASGQAKVLYECLSHTEYSLDALFDNQPGVDTPVSGCPIYYGQSGFLDWLSQQSSIEDCGFVVAIGGGSGRDRDGVFRSLIMQGLEPVSIQHPTAFLAANAKTGQGCQLLAQSAVCVESIVGDNCIVNTAATIDHECIIGDSVHICPGAHISGQVKIGSFSLVGTGAAILPRLTIGENVTIGAGSVVTRDIPSHTVVAGNPARAQKE